MKHRARLFFTLLSVFMVFVYSVVPTASVLADDIVPPADAGVSDSQPAVDPAAETLPTLPEDTNVVVVDESGTSVPLATQAASQALAEGDPMWCPTGVAPKASTGGCSPSFTDFGFDADPDTTSLLGWLNTNDPNKSGTVWVEYNYDSAGENNADIALDGSLYANLDNYALTVQGGWNGIPLSKLLDVNNPYSTFTTSKFFIANWNNAVTINNIIMDGVTINQPGGDQTFYVSTTGNITLNNVIVQGSDNSDDNDSDHIFNGAILDNSTGTGSVTINNSDFSYNEGDGLAVISKGAITATNLTASFNGGTGAWLGNSGTQGKAVTLKGIKQFNNNGSNNAGSTDGLVVISAGAITLSNIVANNNVGDGIRLNNTASTANLGITLGGTNFTMNNDRSGIILVSHGMITASNLNASGNGEHGALIDNCDYNGSTCITLLPKAVKLTGVNTFNNNNAVSNGGLVIWSFGAITVSNVIASHNIANGAEIRNDFNNVNLLAPTGGITLSGYGSFKDNGGNGLEAKTLGNATLANINAGENGGDGLNLEAVKALGGSAITLIGINNFLVNQGDGLNLTANGAITLNNVTASWNADGGANIVNSSLPDKSYNVTLKGTNAFNHNNENGLTVDSLGAILINNLTANDNGEGNVTGSGVILTNCACTPKPITLTGYVNTSDNLEDGLNLDSAGAITLTNVTAEWNGGMGGLLRNDDDPAKGQAITLKGSNMFNHNGTHGLEVYSFGAILINNLMAIGNGEGGSFGTGAILDNCSWNGSSCFTTIAKAVTVSGYAQVSDNKDFGLYVTSNGAVTLTNITAESNGKDGVVIQNYTTSSIGQAVTLKGSNSFNRNDERGLVIQSFGAITANNITAFDNQTGSGVILDNSGALLPKKVTLTGVNAFVGNYSDGLSIYSDGAVLLSRITADSNGLSVAGDGLYVQTAGSITLVCASTTNQTNGTGYALHSTLGGAVVIKGVYSAGNDDADSVITTGLVTITKPCALP